MVFQDGALFPHLTVGDNIGFGLRSSTSANERRTRVEELLELVDLAGAGDRPPETLSGGQQQRVALARSLAPRPRVLLLDEPFSALDASLRVQVRGEVGRILREIGVTTVFVTHDQDEAFVLGDEVAVMRGGRIVQVGTPDELYRAPATPWVASFVGEANFVPGRVDVDRGIASARGDDIFTETYAATALGPVPLDPTAHLGDTGSVTVLIRPEQVDLREGDCAEIVDVEYYGHDVRYELRLADGSTVAARTGPEPLRHRGDRVCARFSGQPAEAWPRPH
jgi:iron(III) transport system ATP-binding protein